MKLNIFSIPPKNIQALKAKLSGVELTPIHEAELSGWKATFYLSPERQPIPIPWVEIFAEYFAERFTDDRPQNILYFATYVLEKDGHCFVLTFGKSHFYVRRFCDHDFGIEVAKRIADDDHIRQTSSRRFQGKRKREIRSLAKNTPLSLESGESLDFLQAKIIPNARYTFGTAARFGSSVQLTPQVAKEQIGDLLDEIVRVLGEEPRFSLPRTMKIDDPEAGRYDALLIAAIAGTDEQPEFTHEGHEIVGVDFVFSGNERYTLSCRRHKKWTLGDNDLNLGTLRSYIQQEGIATDQIFNIKVKIENEGRNPYSKPLKDALDFAVTGENVVLSQGRWLRFNEDYIDQLNTFVDGITVEDTEPELEIISVDEPTFNTSAAVVALGYTKADKDFSKISTKAPAPVEAWDLYREGTAYAVKFGPTQKIGYVCDQAFLVLEVLRTNANLKKLDQDVKAYCLWLVLPSQRLPNRLSELKSIILKQKIDAWARKCNELGVQPRIKLSLRRREKGNGDG